MLAYLERILEMVLALVRLVVLAVQAGGVVEMVVQEGLLDKGQEVGPLPSQAWPVEGRTIMATSF
jgi:hypothetical protein